MMNTYMTTGLILITLLFTDLEHQIHAAAAPTAFSLIEHENNGQHNPSICEEKLQRIQNTSTGIPSFCLRDLRDLIIDPSSAARLVDEVDDPRALQKLVMFAGNNDRQQATEMVSQLRSKDLSEAKRRAVVGPLVTSLGGAQNLSPADIMSFGPELLQNMPGKFIRQLSRESLNTYIDVLFENGTVSPEDFLSSEAGSSLCKRTYHFYREIDSAEVLDEILPMLMCAPVSVCTSLTPDVLEDKMEIITQLPWNCESHAYINEDDPREKLKDRYPQMSFCARFILETLTPRGIFDADMFNSLGTLSSCFNKLHYFFLVMTSECSELNLIAETNNIFKYSSVRKAMMDKCEIEELDQPGNLTAENLLNMGPLAVELGKNVLQDLSPQALCDADFVSMVKSNPNTPKRMRKAIAKKCYRNRNLNASDITEMGSEIMLKLGINQLRESVGSSSVVLDSNTRRELKTALKAGKGDRRIKTLRRELQEKFPVKDLADSPEIMREVPLNRFRSEVVDIRQDLGLDNNSTSVDLPDTVSKWGIAQWLQDTPLGDITADMLQDMKTLVRGFLSSHIRQLNRADPLYSASVLCEINDWPSKTAKAIAREFLVEYLKEENSTNYMSAMTVTDVSMIGPECLMFLRPDELVKSSTDVCVAICEKLGSTDRTLCLPHNHRSMLKESCLFCLGKNDSSTSITEEDIDTLGYSLATELSSEFSRMNASVIKNRISSFKHGCISGHFLDSIGSKLIEAYGSADGLIPPDIMELGALLMVYAINNNSIDDIPVEILSIISEELREEINPEDERMQQNLQCCLRGLTEPELLRIEIARKRVYNHLIESSLIQEILPVRRRKRDSNTLTCDDITSMGSIITSVSVIELQAIDSVEFSNCVGVMSQYSDWEVSKRDALLMKVTNDVGHVCNLTTSDIVDVGYFLLSMNESDINCLPLVDDDVVSTLGSMSEWSSVQLDQLALHYLEERSVTVGSLAHSDVAVLGNLLCGFQTSTLGQMTSSAFVGASAQIGRLGACDTAHLQTLKEIAARSDALGQISTWGAEVYSEIGVIIGGFTGQQLQALSTDHIEGIPSYAIPHITGSVLSSFSVQQLSSFSFAQADAVSSSQRQALSAAQIEALENPMNLEAQQQQPGGLRSGTGIQNGFQLVVIIMGAWTLVM